MDIENEDLKIKVYLKDLNNLLANANIVFQTIKFGWITIKGFQIWRSKEFNERLQEAINITPPSKQAYGRFIPLVFLEDKKKWSELESLIYNAYIGVRSKNKNEYENINPEEVPI